MSRLSPCCIILTVLAFVAVAAGNGMADMGKAGTLIRDAEKLYFNGNAAEADGVLRQAEDLIAQALTGGDPAEMIKARSLDGKAKRLRTNIDRKLGAGVGPAPVPASPSRTAAGGSPTASAVPSQVQYRLKNINKNVEQGKEWLEKGRVSMARQSLEKARDQMREIEEKYGGKYPADHEDVVFATENLRAFQDSLTEAEARESAGKAEEAMRAEEAVKHSALWVERLKPYERGVGRPDHDPAKYFIGSFTEDEEELVRRTALYTEARAQMEAYRAEGPGEEASDELKEIVRQLDYQVASFAKSVQDGGEMYLRDARTQIEYLHKRSEEEAAKIGTGTLPLPMNKEAVARSRQLLDRASGILGSDDERIVTAEGQYGRIIELDGKIREARLSETRMTPDRFTGKGADEIKNKAKEILGVKIPGVRALRTTIVSPDWNEERVIEWTDTTRSALRYRVTAYVTAQVAGKRGDEAKIYTIHVARDRRSGGDWGPLYGHIMFEDLILEENVDK
ncbi:MAG TPA: hypothetical protein PKL99_02610 [Syntrophales bacterium]|nr:hypothetical protein [Syntrophales bacterium]